MWANRIIDGRKNYANDFLHTNTVLQRSHCKASTFAINFFFLIKRTTNFALKKIFFLISFPLSKDDLKTLWTLHQIFEEEKSQYFSINFGFMQMQHVMKKFSTIFFVKVEHLIIYCCHCCVVVLFKFYFKIIDIHLHVHQNSKIELRYKSRFYRRINRKTQTKQKYNINKILFISLQCAFIHFFTGFDEELNFFFNRFTYKKKKKKIKDKKNYLSTI